MSCTRSVPDHNIIEGSLLGIHQLLFSFVTSYNECEADSKDLIRCKRVFKFMRASIQVSENYKRYVIPQGFISYYKLSFTI